jgi:uncharacterized membrane protein
MLKQIIISAIAMLCLDGLWLGVISKKLYFDKLRHLARTQDGQSFDVNYGAAGAVYVLMVLGFMVFLAPSLQKWSYLETILMASAMGVVVYGVYDFTNLATLREWPLLITLLDMAWGTVLFAVTAVVVKKFA